jgi:hypothetical protein
LDKVLDRAAPEPIKPLPEEPECGINTKSISKILAVQNATASDWPWMAVFLETTNYMNFCDGVLLNRRFVLTAAHCFKRYFRLYSGYHAFPMENYLKIFIFSHFPTVVIYN